MNANQLARLIALREGKKVELSIAQVKEVMRCIALACWDDGEALSAWGRYLGRVWAAQEQDPARKKKLRASVPKFKPIETSLHKRLKGRK